MHIWPHTCTHFHDFRFGNHILASPRTNGEDVPTSRLERHFATELPLLDLGAFGDRRPIDGFAVCHAGTQIDFCFNDLSIPLHHARNSDVCLILLVSLADLEFKR